jgi:hypothetical protein
MRKLDLNIQLFASTNKTTNYELPQFVGTDKPTWLGDFNSAMSAIDTGMAENASDISSLESDVATASATASQASQDVTSLTSTVNTLSGNVTTATNTANNAQSTATSALNTANTANGKADTNASNITSLTTRVAQTEADIANINLTSFENLTTSDVTVSEGSVGSVNVTVAKNSDGSIAKVYGQIELSTSGNGTMTVRTSLRPEETLTINGGCIRAIYSGNTIHNIGVCTMTLATNGNITMPINFITANTNKTRYMFINSMIFIKDFGDAPIPSGD